MSDLTYIMHCGCRFSEDQLIKVKNAKRCPHHPDSGVKHRQYLCPECGELITRSPMGSIGGPCVECQTKKKVAKNRATYFGARGTGEQMAPYDDADLFIAPQQAAAAERCDCLHRNNCLSEISKNARAQALPCDQCENYVSAKEKNLGFIHSRIHGGDHERRIA